MFGSGFGRSFSKAFWEETDILEKTAEEGVDDIWWASGGDGAERTWVVRWWDIRESSMVVGRCEVGDMKNGNKLDGF